MNLFRKKRISQILADVKNTADGHSLKKNLGVWDLTSLGIAAIIGAGIFATIGNASADGGPGVVFLFIFTAFASGFSALCYAEFASIVPISGSAYTYAYATFGELIAWIIGWALIVEYAIGNIAVAISWSDYFTALLNSGGLKIPEYFTIDYLSAARYHTEVESLVQSGKKLSEIESYLLEGYNAWNNAPQIGGLKIICDLPALSIVAIITYLVYIGIQESKTASNLMVALKISVIIAVIVIGTFYVNTDHWSPFLPNGISGVLKGVSAVFFAYIGFDALSTAAEECKNPQKDLPKAMIYSLLICTILYIGIALVLTGMVPYETLRVGDPLAFVFEQVHLQWVAKIVAVSAVIAIASVLLVFQMGQPRIWMSMSRDGLLPPIFGKINPKTQTPGFSTILTGFVVGIPALFMNLTEVTDLTSVGTLFAFVLVCGGILVLQLKNEQYNSKFKVPYLNAKWIYTPLMLTLLFFSYQMNPNNFLEPFIHFHVPTYLFFCLLIALFYLTFRYKLSLIPVLGITSCFYLMTHIAEKNWAYFFIWLIVGLVFYFSYGLKHSKLNMIENQ